MNAHIVLYIRDFAVCFGAAFFYGRIMSVPVKPLIPASLSGAAAYLIYHIISLETGHDLIGCFAASLIVSAVSEILARKLKMPATIFVMPGIIPLVPGVGIYQTMLCLIQNDRAGFFNAGVRTLFFSGIIAVSIAVVNSVARHISKRS